MLLENTEPQRAGPSLVVQIGMLTGLTLLAIGLGWLAGVYLGSESESAQPPAVEQAGHEGATREEEQAPQVVVVDMRPVTTNLAAPNSVWVRLEASLVFEESPPSLMSDEVQQDLLAFLRTVKLHQIEGPSGFQHLKMDLEERAKIRSAGLVKKLLIRTLLFE